MYFSDKINLVTIATTENSMGDMVESVTKIEVFANKKSVRQSEFYQSAATGMRPELMFEVWTDEYSGQPRIEFGSVPYTVIRTYEKNEITELVCQGMVNNATS